MSFADEFRQWPATAANDHSKLAFFLLDTISNDAWSTKLHTTFLKYNTVIYIYYIVYRIW